MSYSSWSVSFAEQPSASKWNILGTNDAYFNSLLTGPGTIQSTVLTNPYKFSVYRNAAQNTSAAAFTNILFDTRLFDTGSNVDIVTNKGRFTAPIAGFYFFSAFANVNKGSGTPEVSLILNKNGSAIIGGTQFDAPTSNPTVIVSGLLQLAISDYVEVGIFHTNATTITTGSTNNNFQGFLVSVT